MATRLFVGNLPENTEEKDVRTAFSSFGEIKNIEIKNKPGNPESKKFGFVTLSASNNSVESCIRHFSIETFKGSKLYVTRARESFLERLERERESEKQRLNKIQEPIAKEEKPKIPAEYQEVKPNLKVPGRKRRFSSNSDSPDTPHPPARTTHHTPKTKERTTNHVLNKIDQHVINTSPVVDRKKIDSEKKRIESLQKKRADFKQKQNIIKNSLTGIDQIKNTKLIFSHDDEEAPKQNGQITIKKPQKINKNTLFEEDDDSDNEVNFEIKKQFEGKMGQKVLDLQSRYKSDKRFVLDERFVEEDHTEKEDDDKIELNQRDEKEKQLDILQDVLGVTLKRKLPDDEKDKKIKPKLGMLRFDPSHPEHAKFLAPVEDKSEPPKKSKKKSRDKVEVTVEEQKVEEKRPEVSKEQFYKVSETLKEAIAQPTTFSLRSLFGTDHVEEEAKEEESAYIPLDSVKKTKVKNPLDPGEKNPFVYDSSDSETEETEKDKETLPSTAVGENKAVWKESLFFCSGDQRLKDGLEFFNSNTETCAQKERRELKSIMKKRIYNKERKNQMFRKKIGGRKKTMKKSFQKRS